MMKNMLKNVLKIILKLVALSMLTVSLIILIIKYLNRGVCECSVDDMHMIYKNMAFERQNTISLLKQNPDVFMETSYAHYGHKNALECFRLCTEDNDASKPVKYLAIDHDSGQLGNQMFRYATFLMTLKQHDFKPVLRHIYDSVLQLFDLQMLPASLNSTLYYKLRYKILKEKGSGIYDDRIEHLLNKNTMLSGYFQSWKYFHKHSDEIKSLFKPREEFKIKAEKILLEERTKMGLNLENSLLVGIHIRRGDFAMDSMQQRGYTVADRDFFIRAMQKMKSMFSDKSIIWIVCSDDISWAIGNINIPGERIRFIEGYDMLIDFTILASCDHSILSTGSYGWWSAYLAGGKTIYYKHWPINNTFLDRDVKREDYFLPDWIPIG